MILGDTDTLRAGLGGGTHTPEDDQGWLLRLAVDYERPEVWKLLLDAGLDPGARARGA